MNLEMLDSDSAAEAAPSTAPAILAAATLLPPNVVDQQSLAARLRELWNDEYGESRRWRTTFDQIQRSVRVDRRYWRYR